MHLSTLTDTALREAHHAATKSYDEVKAHFNRLAALREEAWMRMELIMLEIERRREADRIALRVIAQAGERA